MSSWWRGINWRTFAASMALATAVWALNALDETRTVTFTFQLEPSGTQARWVELPRPQLSASVELSAQDWLAFELFGSRDALALEVKHLVDGTHNISSDALRGQITQRLGSSARVIAFTPPTVEVDVEPVATASVEVRVQVGLGSEAETLTERALISPPMATPAMVSVTGPISVVASLDHVFTAPLEIERYEGDSARLPFDLPAGLNVAVDSADVTWHSSRWVRQTLELDVELRDTTRNRTLSPSDFHRLPSQANVTFFYPEDLPAPHADQFRLVAVQPAGSGLWNLTLPLRPKWAHDPILKPGRIEVLRKAQH